MGENKGTEIPTASRDFKLLHLPSEYDHVGRIYASPLADAALARTRERVQTNPQSVTFIDLQQIISSEIKDVQDQRDEYEQPKENDQVETEQNGHKTTSKEWREQKTLVEKVNNYFLNNPDTETLDVSLATTDDLDKKYTVGREPGKLFYTFKRSGIFTNLAAVHPFEKHISQLQSLDELALKVITGETINQKEKDNLLTYIANNSKRWELKKEYAPEESEEKDIAKDNEYIFLALFRKTRMLVNEGNEAASEAETVLQDDKKQPTKPHTEKHITRKNQEKKYRRFTLPPKPPNYN